MPGSLYLGCGSATDEAPLWLSMFHRPTTRVVYWPFALPDRMCASADQWLRNNLDLLKIGYRLETWRDLADHRPSELVADRFDLLFVGGGNTFRLLDQVKRYGFIDPVRQFWRAGGDYYGGSAGAVLACDDITIADGHDPREPGLDDFDALGLLSGVAVLPHFTEDQLDQARSWAADHHRVVLGLPESAGLRCCDGMAAVIGTGHVTRIESERVERFPAGGSLDLRLP